MSTKTKQRYIGRKIWYGVAITLGVLVILISVGVVAGTWVLGNTLSSITTRVLLVVENTADGLSTLVEQIDVQVAELEEITFATSDATIQLGQNVTDQGLILTLLPEEREQNLNARADELQRNLNSTGETLKNGLELYQSIDSLPIVSLPKPEQESVTKLEQTITSIQERTQEVAQSLQEFRAGVSEEISNVTDLLDEVTARLGEARQNLAEINSNLEALQDMVARWRSMIPFLFTSLSIIVTLLFIWLIYTQVEIIRLYVYRWKGLNGEDVMALPDEEPTDSDLPGTFDADVQEADVPKQPE